MGDNTNEIDHRRTSENSWVPRNYSATIERVFHRLANVLKVPQEKMRGGESAESLQLLRYDIDQEYQPHYDFGGPPPPDQNDRYITVMTSLNDQHPGETG